MGTGLMIATAVAGVAGSVGSFNAAKSDARATAREAETAMQNRKKEILQLAAQQKMGYLDAGLELEGTPQNVIQDTYNTGLEDIKAMESSANKNIKNKMTMARAELFTGLAKTGLSAYAMGGFGSGGGAISESSGMVSSGGFTSGG